MLMAKEEEDELYGEETKSKSGEDDEDVYEEPGREDLTEEDELYPDEEAFLEGETGDEETAECEQCGKVLSDDTDKVFELEIDGQKHFFDSENCAMDFKKKHKPK
jgi:YHS domain-containing protein